MSEYHDRIRNSIEAGEESDYQQDCLNLLAEIAALKSKIRALVHITFEVDPESEFAKNEGRE